MIVQRQVTLGGPHEERLFESWCSESGDHEIVECARCKSDTCEECAARCRQCVADGDTEVYCARCELRAGYTNVDGVTLCENHMPASD